MVKKYGIELDRFRHPVMVEEALYEASGKTLDSPVKIAEFLNESVRLNRKAEEYVYMLAFDTKCNLLGMFEVGHGTANKCILNTREIFMRALLCGAVNIVIAHNHPSSDIYPSKEDNKVAERVKRAGELMGIELLDFIIVGNGVYSYSENKVLYKKKKDISLEFAGGYLFSFFSAAPPRLNYIHSCYAFARCASCSNRHTCNSVAIPPSEGRLLFNSTSHYFVGNGH